MKIWSHYFTCTILVIMSFKQEHPITNKLEQNNEPKHYIDKCEFTLTIKYLSVKPYCETFSNRYSTISGVINIIKVKIFPSVTNGNY